MVNVVVLSGRLSRPVDERELPSGARLAVLDLTVPGAATDGAQRQRAESVPLAWFEAPAWALRLGAGAELVVVGRVRRRFFRAGTGLQSRTEVLVESAAPARRAARVEELVFRAVDGVIGALGGGVTDEDAGVDPPPVPGRRRRRAAPTFP